MFARPDIIQEPELPDGRALVDEGRKLASDWCIGRCPFLAENGVVCEADYKRHAIASGRIMRHAQIGYRDLEYSRRAYREVHDRCLAYGTYIDRYGLCLDWSMGYPAAERADRPQGTGMILDGPEQFVSLTSEAPVAPHFGDFVLGFPSALENTQAALAAGGTAIGNLGQYFTFRLPGWPDDIEPTVATLRALGLIAGQPVEVLAHSNLDDGFAAQFTDLACALGAAQLERDIVEGMIGAPISHCFGHHFSDPVIRLAFLRALQRVGARPGTMLFGNTVSYRGNSAQNMASLGGYLLIDVLGQLSQPSGHAVNPVPVSENSRIPDIDEIVEVQLYAERLIACAEGYRPLLDLSAVTPTVETLIEAGVRFRDSVLGGLAAGGFKVDDPFELLLALRRIGARRLEAAYGPGDRDEATMRRRRPVVPAGTFRELEEAARACLADFSETDRAAVAGAGLTVLTASTDVHEHGKVLLDKVLAGLGVEVSDGGVSVDPDVLAAQAAACNADAIALSTYNGVALSYFRRLRDELAQRGLDTTVLIGGRLNEIPPGSNTSLPSEVGPSLAEEGALPCPDISDLLPALLALPKARSRRE